MTSEGPNVEAREALIYYSRGRRGWLGSLQWLHHSPLPRRPLSWPSTRHRATRQLSDLSWYTVSCLMIRRRLAQLRLHMEVVHPSI